MPWPFDPLRDLWRTVARCRRNRLAALQVVGGALIIALATAANPGQEPAPDEGAYGSTEAPAKGARLQQFPHAGLFRILGKEVSSPSGHAMGRIVDLLVDETGQPCATIIDFGGFLGVGIRKIAIDWHALRFAEIGTSEAVVTDLDRDQIKAAPEYKDSRESVAIVTAAKSDQQRITSNPGW